MFVFPFLSRLVLTLSCCLGLLGLGLLGCRAETVGHPPQPGAAPAATTTPGLGVVDAVTPDPAGHSRSPTPSSCTLTSPALPPSPPPPTRIQEHDQASQEAAQAYFAIAVIDTDTEAPVRGALLTTTSDLQFKSDDAGLIAFYEPGLMGQQVYFEVQHPHYVLTQETLGFRGQTLVPRGGERAVLAMKRKTAGHVPPQGDWATRALRSPVPTGAQCFGLRALDSETKRGVPLIGFSDGHTEYWSDSHGLIAICDPQALGRPMVMHVQGHGYVLAEGTDTWSHTPQAGQVIDVPLRRTLAAQRLYRLTGQGAYVHSARLHYSMPLQAPLMDGRVAGQDSGDSELYQGRLFWVWGDTESLGAPLGNFRAAGAMSQLPSERGLPGHVGVDLHYFVERNGFTSPMVGAFGGDMPTWIDGLVSVPDTTGRPRLYAGYMKADKDMSEAEVGLVRYDDARHRFWPKLRNLPKGPGGRPMGNSYLVRHGAEPYAYFRWLLRIPANSPAFLDPKQHEVYSALGAERSAELQRMPDGTPLYAFRRQAKPTTRKDLQAAGLEQGWGLDDNQIAFGSETHLQLVGTSESHSAYRQRFIRLGQEMGGETSDFGEIWYLEADTPMGPWVYARKIVTHQNYTFYNVRQHPHLAPAHGRMLLFDGTFTTTFAGVTDLPKVPRYDYNQIMYSLDLDAAPLNLPVPVYDLAHAGTPPGRFALKRDLHFRNVRGPLRAPFMALERPGPGTVAVYSGPACAGEPLQVAQPSSHQEQPREQATSALFYGLPLDMQPSPPGTLPLYGFQHADGRYAYSVETTPALPTGFKPTGPLLLVWRNPVLPPLPVNEYLGDVVADAGPDRCLKVAEGEDHVAVTLDGRRSKSQAGPLQRFIWLLTAADHCTTLHGEQTTVELPVGRHQVILEVKNDAGQTDRDSFWIEVESSPAR